jgi:hypothetical protein
MSMIDSRAICHEAGHAIIAMNFGLAVTGICVKESIPTASLDVTEATTQQACVVYAGGAAAEKVVLGCFDEASDFDRRMISDAGGGKLEDHLDYAMKIIRANPTCHKEMCNEMANNWVSEESASIWPGSSSDKLNFELLTGTRIKEIWQLYHP